MSTAATARTSTLARGCLTEWHKMGGKVIITSDAHDTASLTFGFDEAAEAVKAAGFSRVWRCSPSTALRPRSCKQQVK